MRSNLKFTLNDERDFTKKLELKVAPKGFQIFIEGKLRFSGMSFSLFEINERFQTWTNWGCSISFSGKGKKPKVLNSVK